MMKIHTLPMGPVQANCYVVIDEHSGEAAVIDPGDYTDELKSVLRDEVKNLKYILLTHGHYDHILGVAHIKDDYPDAKISLSILFILPATPSAACAISKRPST